MNLAALESLEGRQLMAYTSLGYSLPDLQISGAGGTVAAWQGSYQVRVTLQNTGASTIIEPTALTPTTQLETGPDGNIVPPYATSSMADATDTVVGVYLARSPRSLAGAIKLGTFDAGTVLQNSMTQVESTLTLPSQPSGFRASGVYYLRFVANDGNTILESNFANNVSAPVPVRFVSQALPQLRATALSLQDGLQPGDTVAPTFQITNYGTAASGPVEVALVASTSRDFNLGSSIVALYTINNVPSQSVNPVRVAARGHRRLAGTTLVDSLNPGANVITFTGDNVTLPTSPDTYFIGLVVDPYNKLTQLSTPTNRLEQIRQVGRTGTGLPASGVITSPLVGQFPNTPDGEPIGLVNTNAL